MLLSKPEITKMFRKAAQVWNENKDYLSEIDSRFGDGDHGVTIGKIAGSLSIVGVGFVKIPPQFYEKGPFYV